jgi:hypothetical protein
VDAVTCEFELKKRDEKHQIVSFAQLASSAYLQFGGALRLPHWDLRGHIGGVVHRVEQRPVPAVRYR